MTNKPSTAQTSREGLSDKEVENLPTLEKTLFKTFGTFVTVSMLLICVILIVSIVVTGSATESISEDGLNDQIEDHLRSSAVELSAKVGLRLQTIEDSVVKFMAGVHGETFLGNDVLAVPDPDFFYNDSFSVGELDRFEIDEEATLDHSIWYQRSDVTPEPADLHNIKDSSSKMHYFYRNLWRNHESVVAMYTGYEANELYRYYPGFKNFEDDFDPTSRPWYEAAISAGPEDVGHVPPYVDAFGHGWMITISKAFCVDNLGNPTEREDCPENVDPDQDGHPSNLVGVAGADITIAALQEEILDVEFFNENTATMVLFSDNEDDDGRVVASRHWDSAEDEEDENADPPLIYELPGSGIDKAQWDKIRNPEGGARVMRYTKKVSGDSNADQGDEVGTRWVLARSFVPLHENDRPGANSEDNNDNGDNGRGPRYVIFVEASEDTVEEPLDDLKSEISSSRRDLLIIAIFLSIAVWLIVMALIKYTAWKITGPLRKMMEVATVITSEAANDGDMEGELSTDIPEPNDEIGEFVREFQTMVHGLNKGGVKGSKVHDYVDNPFYREEGSSQPLPWSDALK